MKIEEKYKDILDVFETICEDDPDISVQNTKIYKKLMASILKIESENRRSEPTAINKIRKVLKKNVI